MKHILFFFIALVVSTNIFAQSNDIDIDDFYMDFAVTEISAFSILDIEPNKVSKPGNVKEFALGLTNYINKDGDLRPGLAVEWAPFKTLTKDTSKWSNKFEFKNLAISLATTNDSLNLKVAAALKWAPIDRTNPLSNPEVTQKLNDTFFLIANKRQAELEHISTRATNFNSDFFQYLRDKVKVSTPEAKIIAKILEINSYTFKQLSTKFDGQLFDRKILIDQKLSDLRTEFSNQMVPNLFDQKQLTAFSTAYVDLFYYYKSGTSFHSLYQTEIIKIKEEFKKKNWNKLSIQLNVGGLFESEEANLADLKEQYTSGSFTTAFPLMTKDGREKNSTNKFLRDHSQILLQARFTDAFENAIEKNDELFLGSRLIIGNSDKRFSFEIAYLDESNEIADISQSGVRYSIGAELKIMNNYWLEFAIGGQDFEDKNELNLLPSFAFRYAFGDENRFFKK